MKADSEKVLSGRVVTGGRRNKWAKMETRGMNKSDKNKVRRDVFVALYIIAKKKNTAADASNPDPNAPTIAPLRLGMSLER